MRSRLFVVGVSLAALAMVGVAPAVVAAESETTIVVDAVTPQGPASTDLLGVNHRYNDNGYGLWNLIKDAPTR